MLEIGISETLVERKSLSPVFHGTSDLGWEGAGGRAAEMWLLTSGAPPNVAPPA